MTHYCNLIRSWSKFASATSPLQPFSLSLLVQREKLDCHIASRSFHIHGVCLPSLYLGRYRNLLPSSAASSNPSPPEEIKPVDSSSHDQVVTPWDVQGSVNAEGVQQAIDYNKLISQFGTKPIDQALLDRFEKLTGQRPHPLLRRGTFFSHRWDTLLIPISALYRLLKSGPIREFDRILDRFEQGKPFFLYTGRGPSSDSMHLGHMIPFVFTKLVSTVKTAISCNEIHHISQGGYRTFSMSL